MYLEHVGFMIKAVYDKDLTNKERVLLVWKFVTFLRLWRASLIAHGIDINSHFISDQCFADSNYLGEGFLSTMLYLSTHYPYMEFQPWNFGSDPCEKLFGKVRGFVKGKSNICVSEFMDIANRIRREEQVLSNCPIKDRHGHTKKERSCMPSKRYYQTPDKTEQMINEQMKLAEECTIDTMSRMGILNNNLCKYGFLSQNDAGQYYLTDRNKHFLASGQFVGNNDSEGEMINEHDNGDDPGDNDDDDGEGHIISENEANGTSVDMVATLLADVRDQIPKEAADHANDISASNSSGSVMECQEKRLKEYIYVERLECWMHPAEAVSHIVNRVYNPSRSRNDRFYKSKRVDVQQQEPENISRTDTILRRGSHIAVWDGTDGSVVYGQIVRIMLKKFKNYYPYNFMKHSQSGSTSGYFVYIAKADINDSREIHSRSPDEYMFVSDCNIMMGFESNVVSDEEAKHLKDLTKIRKEKLKQKQALDEKKLREMDENKLTIPQIKKFLAEYGIIKGLSGCNKAKLADRLKLARGKPPTSSTPSSTGHANNYDGSNPPGKDVFFSNIFTYEDNFNCFAKPNASY